MITSEHLSHYLRVIWVLNFDNPETGFWGPFFNIGRYFKPEALIKSPTVAAIKAFPFILG